MTPPREVATLVQRLDRPEAGERLRAVAELRGQLEDLESTCVADVVREGWSWAQIGAALGITKQAAHARHRNRPAVRLAHSNGQNGDRQVSVSSDTRRAVQIAREEAERLGRPSVGTEHLLLGILQVPSARTADALRSRGITLERARAAAEPRHDLAADAAPATVVHERHSTASPRRPISRVARRALERSLRRSVNGGGSRLEVDDLLVEMLDDAKSGAVRTLERLGVSAHDLRARLT